MKIYSRLQRPAVRVLIAVVLALAALAPGTAAPRAASAAGPFLVDTIVDSPDSDLSDGACIADAGGCSLRAAIGQASWDLLPRTISFDPSLSGNPLVLNNADGTILWYGDNFTVTGGANNILISGAALSGSKSLIRITGSGNVLKNVTLAGAPGNGVEVGDFDFLAAGNDNRLEGLTVVGNGGAGIFVNGGAGGGQNNQVISNTIGLTNPYGPGCAAGDSNFYGILVDNSPQATLAAGNTIGCSWAEGVRINGSDIGPENTMVVGNSIGANLAGVAIPNGGNGVIMNGGAAGVTIANNIISGNHGGGVEAIGPGTRQVTVTQNYIGLNNSGLEVPNRFDGVSVNFMANAGMTIDSNTISGNGFSGVWIFDSSQVTVTGNRIGTDPTGMWAIHNYVDGVTIHNAHHNRVGGDGPSARNIISGNDYNGVSLESGAHDNIVDGNFIGLNAAGSAAIGNLESGVWVSQSLTNSIGSPGAISSQYISGNYGDGILVSSSPGTYIGPTNFIGPGTNPNVPVGNGGYGIWLKGTTNARVEVLDISYNRLAGVGVSGSSSVGNKVGFNANYANGGLPVDLNIDGATANDGEADGDMGPNTLLNYPVITGLVGTTVTGTACHNCGVAVFAAFGNPALPGGGGQVINTTLADGAGHWILNSLPPGLTRFDLSAIACNTSCSGAAGNTSEMSPRPHLVLPIVLR